MKDLINRWLDPKGPSALVLREYLISAEGKDAAFYPPTFAPPEEEAAAKSGYVKDAFTYLVDSVESQANRMEALFLQAEYKNLVPQIIVQVKKDKKLAKEFSLLTLGHRAADALIRFSKDWRKFEEAFLEYRDQGNAEPLAKLAPTSLIFGAWDSRKTQTKVPRIVRSEIRAFNAQELSRAAQYVPPIDYRREGILAEEILERKKEGKKIGSLEGFYPVATRLLGGIVLKPDGFIRRDASLSLILIRLLRAGSPERTRLLQEYILGLSLLVFVSPQDYYLRQWCQLTLDPEKRSELYEVYRDGTRTPLTLNLHEVENFAREAASKFGVGDSFTTEFVGEEVEAQLRSQK